MLCVQSASSPTHMTLFRHRKIFYNAYGFLLIMQPMTILILENLNSFHLFK